MTKTQKAVLEALRFGEVLKRDSYDQYDWWLGGGVTERRDVKELTARSLLGWGWIEELHAPECAGAICFGITSNGRYALDQVAKQERDGPRCFASTEPIGGC